MDSSYKQPLSLTLSLSLSHTHSLRHFTHNLHSHVPPDTYTLEHVLADDTLAAYVQKHTPAHVTLTHPHIPMHSYFPFLFLSRTHTQSLSLTCTKCFWQSTCSCTNLPAFVPGLARRHFPRPRLPLATASWFPSEPGHWALTQRLYVRGPGGRSPKTG